MAEKWTKTSAVPPSGVMKPKPFSPLNHFTVPCVIFLLLAGGGTRTVRGPADPDTVCDDTNTETERPRPQQYGAAISVPRRVARRAPPGDRLSTPSISGINGFVFLDACGPRRVPAECPATRSAPAARRVARPGPERGSRTRHLPLT